MIQGDLGVSIFSSTPVSTLILQRLEPTLSLAILTMIFAVSIAAYHAGETEIPPMRVTICVSNDFAKESPEFVDFLRNYQTSSALTSEALAHMQDTGDDYAATARWFLLEHPELVDSWLSPEQADTLRAAL